MPAATSTLAALLKERGTRTLFLRAGGVQLLPQLIKSSNSPTNSQLLYEACLCVWQMTFIKPATEALAQSGVWGVKGTEALAQSGARGGGEVHGSPGTVRCEGGAVKGMEALAQ